jgi:hypothetical protein
MVYDVLRSNTPADFFTSAICLESNDGPNSTATDLSNPAIQAVFFYLVRAQDACPSGEGPLGTRSGGSPITGRSCPQ